MVQEISNYHNTWTTINLHHRLFFEIPLVVVPALRDVTGVLVTTYLGDSVDLISKCVVLGNPSGGCVCPSEAKILTSEM